MRYRLSARAQQDLLDIYLVGEERFGSRQADRYANLFTTGFRASRRLSWIGTAPPELGGSRICRVGAHIVVYRIGDDTLFVIRVRHGHEDWQSEEEGMESAGDGD